MVVGLTDARKQHQAYVVHLIRGDHDDVRRLIPLVVVLVDEGHASSGFPVVGQIHAQHFSLWDDAEVLTLHQCRHDARLRTALRPVAAAEELAIPAVRARRHMHAERIHVRTRGVARGHRERVQAEIARGLVEHHGDLCAFQRRQRIVARTRTFEWIAARLDLALDVARAAGGAGQPFELVVIRLQVAIGHAPVLHGQAIEQFVRAVAFDRMALRDEVGGQKAPRHTVPVRARAAHANAELVGVPVAQRQRGLIDGVAKRERFDCGRLHQRAARRETQFIGVDGGREVARRVAPRATFDRHHVQARLSQFVGHQRT